MKQFLPLHILEMYLAGASLDIPVALERDASEIFRIFSPLINEFALCTEATEIASVWK